MFFKNKNGTDLYLYCKKSAVIRYLPGKDVENKGEAFQNRPAQKYE